jgi:Flp pilus assembly CpaE family ATPase
VVSDDVIPERRREVPQPPKTSMSSKIILFAVAAVMAVVVSSGVSTKLAQDRAACRASATAEFNKTMAKIFVDVTAGQTKEDLKPLARKLQREADGVDKC